MPACARFARPPMPISSRTEADIVTPTVALAGRGGGPSPFGPAQRPLDSLAMNPRIVRFAALLLLQATALLTPAAPARPSNLGGPMTLLATPALGVADRADPVDGVIAATNSLQLDADPASATPPPSASNASSKPGVPGAEPQPRAAAAAAASSPKD